MNKGFIVGLCHKLMNKIKRFIDDTFIELKISTFHTLPT